MTNAELCREARKRFCVRPDTDVQFESGMSLESCGADELGRRMIAAIEALEKERGEQERSLEACRDELNRIRAALRDTFTEW